ncbi:hypothetical protein LOAG_07510 [Loa loa]|uniref:Uncharacterized protein n=1 Tax=Loa loa TaxID=7209 RepID=A0A1S0TW44_LOALO|nr:hypothetical protein LOAG_07510 [Loa loa]EFO20977.1 hypothetical protein LOAG_07510 [Loa loa]
MDEGRDQGGPTGQQGGSDIPSINPPCFLISMSDTNCPTGGVSGEGTFIHFGINMDRERYQEITWPIVVEKRAWLIRATVHNTYILTLFLNSIDDYMSSM